MKQEMMGMQWRQLEQLLQTVNRSLSPPQTVSAVFPQFTHGSDRTDRPTDRQTDRRNGISDKSVPTPAYALLIV